MVLTALLARSAAFGSIVAAMASIPPKLRSPSFTFSVLHARSPQFLPASKSSFTLRHLQEAHKPRHDRLKYTLTMVSRTYMALTIRCSLQKKKLCPFLQLWSRLLHTSTSSYPRIYQSMKTRHFQPRPRNWIQPLFHPCRHSQQRSSKQARSQQLKAVRRRRSPTSARRHIPCRPCLPF